MDLLTIRPDKGEAKPSAMGMLQIWSFFISGITFESLNIVLLLLMRNFWQTLLIYVLVLTPTRIRHREQPPVPGPNPAPWQRSASPR
jgi:predicted cobalt transporter CbtA